MPDMLVKLYELPDLAPVQSKLEEQGIVIRRGLPPEKHLAAEWVERTFQRHWRSELEAAYSRLPVSCFIAQDVSGGKAEMVGFACYEATAKDFFGPTGVNPDYRGKGIGKALLLAALHAMRAEGYAYAIIGSAGPTAFYEKEVGAIAIPDSSPGIYKHMLR
ncbi:Acetyltransferase (GNAT) family protein [compost metagenome]